MTAISPPALTDAIRRLREAGCVFAEDEADVLAGAAPDEATLTALVGRRALGEPLEQVVGYADFCGVRVRLRPGVFVPRVRSELLVRLATDAARAAAPTNSARPTVTSQHDTLGSVVDPTNSARPTGTSQHDTLGSAGAPPTPAASPGGTQPIVVDLCCGSGALGLAVRHRYPEIELHAADIDPVAVACARDNLGGGDGVHQGDLFDALPARLRGRIDVLIANVPYVATHHIPLLPSEARDHEPRTALDGGDDGLDVFRSVVAGAAGWLAPGGVLFSEITEAQSGAAVRAVREAGLDGGVHLDDDLEARVVRGRKSAGHVR